MLVPTKVVGVPKFGDVNVALVKVALLDKNVPVNDPLIIVGLVRVAPLAEKVPVNVPPAKVPPVTDGVVIVGVVIVGVVIVGLTDKTLAEEPVDVVTPVPPDVTANGLAKVIEVLLTVIAVTLPLV